MLNYCAFDVATFTEIDRFTMTVNDSKVDSLIDWMIDREELAKFSPIYLGMYEGEEYLDQSIHIQIHPELGIGNLYYDGLDMLRSYCGYENDSYGIIDYPDSTGHSIDSVSERYHINIDQIRECVNSFVSSYGRISDSIRWVKVPESGLPDGESPFHNPADVVNSKYLYPIPE